MCLNCSAYGWVPYLTTVAPCPLLFAVHQEMKLLSDRKVQIVDTTCPWVRCDAGHACKWCATSHEQQPLHRQQRAQQRSKLLSGAAAATHGSRCRAEDHCGSSQHLPL